MSGEAPSSLRSRAFFARLSQLQLERPWVFMAGAVLLLAVSLAFALRLRVSPGFEALLPESRQSVQELNRVKERTTGVSTVFVVIEGDDTDALRKAADAVVVELAKVERPWVGSVESGVHESLDFLAPRIGLYADLDKLEGLQDKLDERWTYEVGKAAGTLLEESGYTPPEINPETLRADFGVTEEDEKRFPDGYYQSQDGKAVVVVARSAVLGTDYAQGNEALRRIREVVERVEPKSFHPSIHWGLSGDLVSSIAEYNAINDDLTEVGLLGTVFIVGVVFLFYLRARTLIAMMIIIGLGVAATFGATEVLVGQLNMATGFLFTIVAGNGINSGIIFMARYLEARRAGEGTGAAVERAHRDTWLPTLTAAGAASASYLSLVVTEFRGFHDFGLIGGAGMIICWLVTYLFLPSVLAIIERVTPLEKSKTGLFGLLPGAAAGGTRFGHPFAALVARAPRAVALGGAALTIVAAFAMVRWVRGDPMEYNLLNLRIDSTMRADELRRTDLAESVTGQVGYQAMAIMTQSPEQVPELVATLEKKRDDAPADQKPFKDLHTLQQMVPADQAKKIPILLHIKDLLLKSRKRGFISEEDFAKVENHLPPADLRPFGIAELPDAMARPFTESDGQRGRIVYISPIDSDAVDDAHYLFRWADSYRRTELADGSVILGSGRAVIFADIWAAVVADVPKAVGVSLGLTLLVVALAFRKGFALFGVMVSLLMGVVWMAGVLGATGTRLNFLNFIALPITFGVGVDYAVNIMQRYRHDGPGSVLTAVRETGGAVILCSLTTTLGYLALTKSTNHAVRSMGVAAVIGEVACLLAAVIVLPAALVWRDQRAKR